MSEIGINHSMTYCGVLLTNLLFSTNSINDVAEKSLSDAFPLGCRPTLTDAVEFFSERVPMPINRWTDWQHRWWSIRPTYNYLQHRKRRLNRRLLQRQRCRHRIHAETEERKDQRGRFSALTIAAIQCPSTATTPTIQTRSNSWGTAVNCRWCGLDQFQVTSDQPGFVMVYIHVAYHPLSSLRPTAERA